jgi:hypothetical protein
MITKVGERWWQQTRTMMLLKQEEKSRFLMIHLAHCLHTMRHWMLMRKQVRLYLESKHRSQGLLGSLHLVEKLERDIRRERTLGKQTQQPTLLYFFSFESLNGGLESGGIRGDGLFAGHWRTLTFFNFKANDEHSNSFAWIWLYASMFLYH